MKFYREEDVLLLFINARDQWNGFFHEYPVHSTEINNFCLMHNAYLPKYLNGVYNRSLVTYNIHSFLIPTGRQQWQVIIDNNNTFDFTSQVLRHLREKTFV